MSDPHPDVARWLDYLSGLNRTEETLRTYASVMRGFVAVVPDPLAAEVDDLDLWWTATSDLTPRARTRALSCVRSFYSWAVDYDLILRSPARRLRAPKQPQRLPRPVTRDELARLLAQTDGEVRRAIALGAYAGLRVAEAAALNWRDVDLEERRIIVRGKGDKERPVGLSVLLADALGPNVGGNVVTAGGQPYSANTLQAKVNRAMRAAGVEASFHKLRARFATVALASTGNLLAVSRALGHASPTTTAIYAATADSDLDVIADAVSR